MDKDWNSKIETEMETIEAVHKNHDTNCPTKKRHVVKSVDKRVPIRDAKT